MPPRLDLLALLRKRAIWMAVLSVAATIFGGFLLLLGLVTGFVLCVAIPLLIGGPVVGILALAQLVYPEMRLTHLGGSDARRAALASIEAECGDPRAVYQKTRRGFLWVLPSWIVLSADDELLVERRRDLLLSYVQVTDHRRYGIRTRTSHALKIRSRARDYTCPMEAGEADWFASTFARAAPWSVTGYQPQWVSCDRRYLAAEVDRRAATLAIGPGAR